MPRWREKKSLEIFLIKNEMEGDVPKFPKTLCVKIETDASAGNDYFVATEDIDGMVEMGEKILVGVYKLIELKTVEGVAQVNKKQAVK